MVGFYCFFVIANNAKCKILIYNSFDEKSSINQINNNMQRYNYQNRLDDLYGKENLTLEQSDIILLRDMLRLLFDRTQCTSKDRLSILTDILRRQYPDRIFDMNFIISIGIELGIFQSDRDLYLHDVLNKSRRLSKNA